MTPSGLTLSEIAALLRIAAGVESQEERVDESCAAFRAGLLSCHLIRGRWQTTPKGDAFIEAIRALPLPVEETRWVMPKGDPQ